MTSRVVVFIDGQNMYKGARDAFFMKDNPAICGQFNPIQLAYWVTQSLPKDHDANDTRKLVGVRVYQGSPIAKYDPKGHSADRRHRAAWENKGVTVIARPLRYMYGKEPREKGVDVALAVDFVGMGIDGDYDIGVLASADTDLVPALDYVLKRGLRVETAVWLSDTDYSLKVPGYEVWCHQMRKHDYDRMADETDYNVYLKK